MNQPRVIKKYPNRRLYDTADSKYITLADIRRLVMDGVEFVVIDKESRQEITRQILLQVITDQEQQGEPVLSQAFLARLIRACGGTARGRVGRHLEQGLALFMAQQRPPGERPGSLADAGPHGPAGGLAERPPAQWQALPPQSPGTMTGAAHAKRNEPGRRK